MCHHLNANRVSHAIANMPSLNAAPFNPTICSVDKLVSKREPAITTPVRLLPPRKYPSLVFSFVFRVAK